MRTCLHSLYLEKKKKHICSKWNNMGSCYCVFVYVSVESDLMLLN